MRSSRLCRSKGAHAVELPLVLQRRVAVTATITLGDTRLRLVSAHLDPRGPPGHRWLGAAGRALQAQHLLSSLRDDTVILGADLNLGRGRYERAWRLLGEAGFTFGVPPSLPRWRHTFHALPRLVLDYLLVRDRGGAIAEARGAPAGRAPPGPRGTRLRLRSPSAAGADRSPTLERRVSMSDLLGFGSDLPWWAWTLMVIGVMAIIGVIGALFLPDWPSDDFTVGFKADPGSERFVEWTSGYLNSPVLQGGEVTILQNGDAFYPAMLDAIRKAKDSVNFEVYIFEPDEIGRQFMEAFKDRARAGVEVRLLLDGFGGIKMTKRYRDELFCEAGVTVSRFRPFGLRSLVRFYKRTHRRAIVIDGEIAFTGGARLLSAAASPSRTSLATGSASAWKAPPRRSTAAPTKSVSSQP